MSDNISQEQALEYRRLCTHYRQPKDLIASIRGESVDDKKGNNDE